MTTPSDEQALSELIVSLTPKEAEATWRRLLEGTPEPATRESAGASEPTQPDVESTTAPPSSTQGGDLNSEVPQHRETQAPCTSKLLFPTAHRTPQTTTAGSPCRMDR